VATFWCVPGRYNRHPIGPGLLAVLVLAAAALWAVFLFDAIGYAYARIGIGRDVLFGLVAASLLGGMVNIPIARLRGRTTVEVGEIRVYGVRYRVPLVSRGQSTVLAVNLGGALIPTGVSLLLAARDDLWGQSAAGVAIVAAVAWRIARPVPGLGIALPGLVPPIVAAAAALLIASPAPAASAYISGSLGTLIGADLLHLRHVRELGAAMVSIGGAGTFDGVFMSGILAALLVI
jgi:uncharacterized membrane protein